MKLADYVYLSPKIKKKKSIKHIYLILPLPCVSQAIAFHVVGVFQLIFSEVHPSVSDMTCYVCLTHPQDPFHAL